MRFMISVELTTEDLTKAIKTEVGNLPGMLFAGTSPLLKPFMKKMEDLLPVEKKGRGDSYILSTLYSHIDSIEADESLIRVKSGNKLVEIRREELAAMIGGKYPKANHQKLNLPGILFLQSSPGLQACTVSRARSEHGLRLPEGRRTLRYVFHFIVVSIEADKERIRIGLEPERLPRRSASLNHQMPKLP